MLLTFNGRHLHNLRWLGEANSDFLSLSCMRQGSASTGGSCKIDWVHHLRGHRFPDDYWCVAGPAAAEAAKYDAWEVGSVEVKILEEHVSFSRQMLAGTMIRHRFPHLFRLPRSHQIDRISNLVLKVEDPHPTKITLKNYG